MIGPTRLNYARIVPMVEYTARVVTRVVGGGEGARYFNRVRATPPSPRHDDLTISAPRRGHPHAGHVGRLARRGKFPYSRAAIAGRALTSVVLICVFVLAPERFVRMTRWFRAPCASAPRA